MANQRFMWAALLIALPVAAGAADELDELLKAAKPPARAAERPEAAGADG